MHTDPAVLGYINNIDPTRLEAFQKIRQTILDHLPEGFQECINYGMIGYVVPHSLYPKGYHCDPKLPLPFVNLAAQKNNISLYHMGIYANKTLYDWFTAEYTKHCSTKLDMGKSCIRFKKMNDIPYTLIAELMQRISVQEWIDLYEKSFTR